MDLQQEAPQSPNPKAKANFLSSITFSWTFGLFRKGYSRDLDDSDLCVPLDEYDSKVLGDQIEDAWNTQLKKCSEDGKGLSPCLWACLRVLFGWKLFLLTLGVCLFDLVTTVGQPIFLGKFLQFFTPNSTVSSQEATLYAGSIAVVIFLHQIGNHPLTFSLMYFGMRVRVSLSSLIYRKLLKVSVSSCAAVTGGYVVNLLTNDASSFECTPLYLPDAVGGLLTSLVVTFLLWNEIGVAAFVGLSTLIFFVPIEAILAKKSSTLRERTAKRADIRIQLMNEIIQGMQAIKMYAWEKRFAVLVERSRRKEVNAIRSKQYYTGIAFACSIFLAKIAFFICVVYIVLSGGKITADKMFTTIMYFDILQESLTVRFPLSIKKLAECFVAVRRMREFLVKPESESSASASVSVPGSAEVSLTNVSGRWTEEQQCFSLKDLNVSIASPMTVAVIGQVGSGKSSLLQLILREMPYINGRMSIRGSVSYASQEPWLFTGSVVQNILFGLPMDEHRYRKVISACALEEDLKQFPRGDKTLVGEHGHSLSGGQRARINLARAVYRQADIYLLDDPLSAVDSHVGRHIFADCITGLLSQKIVILCTHQLHYLNNVDHIIVIKNGYIDAQGPFHKLNICKADSPDYMRTQSECTGAPDKDYSARKLSICITTSDEISDEPLEMKSIGQVNWKVYVAYFRAVCSVPTFFLLLALLGASQAFTSGSDYWTGYWVDLEESVFQVGNTISSMLLGDVNQVKCLWILGVLTAVTVLLNLTRIVAFVYFCMQGSKNLHDRMFHSVSKATMSFFDKNASGRILTRFSRDIGVIDEHLPGALSEFLECSLQMVGTLTVISVINYWLLLPALLIGVLFARFRQVYLMTSRSLKRLEGLTSSPIFTHTNATLEGLTTIRSMNASDKLAEEFDTKQNINSSAVFYTMGTESAFAYWLDFMCSTYSILVIFSFLVFNIHFTGGEVGLTITQAMSLVFMCQWVARQAADVENFMTSVERVLEFHNVESEETRLCSRPEHGLPKDFISSGNITFRNVFLRYSPKDPPVLKGLNFTISPGEKVGIVGRTGAGKSSLIGALFHLYPVEGTILIDKIDTRNVGLHDLRFQLAVIPQEPVLFTGTLRLNIDPFEQFNDDDLWAVLDDVKMKSFVEGKIGGLYFAVSEGGRNLSVGQRQLICLARAILRKNKVLILDEATANLDRNTDHLIQATIRRKFLSSTVLTIAHRLDTVMDCDRIMVLDCGQVAEFGKPSELLQNPFGFFSHLFRQAGCDKNGTIFSTPQE